MIWRIRERAAFDRLGRDGKRIRATPYSAARSSGPGRSPLWCSYLADVDATPPRVAFAIGRAVGPAVVRNRLRRRCRAALRDLERAGLLASGWYLIGATPAAVELTFDQLAETLALLAGGAREMAAQVQARPEGESSAVVMAGA